jgi:hypothetical protein
VADAERGCELVGRADGAHLWVRGAACAAAGWYADAAWWETRALEDADYARERGPAGRARRAPYRDGKPFRAGGG